MTTEDPNDFERNSFPSDQLKKALYQALKSPRCPLKELRPKGPYRDATPAEDKFDKIDLFMTSVNDVEYSYQIRSYNQEWYKPGFPVRDSRLVHGSEFEKLKAGILDDVWFVFAEHRMVGVKIKEHYFAKIKIVRGSSLKTAIKDIVAVRRFSDSNSIVFIADPPDTVRLRWMEISFVE